MPFNNRSNTIIVSVINLLSLTIFQLTIEFDVDKYSSSYEYLNISNIVTESEEYEFHS